MLIALLVVQSLSLLVLLSLGGYAREIRDAFIAAHSRPGGFVWPRESGRR